jgi:hypothetical protein
MPHLSAVFAYSVDPTQTASFSSFAGRNATFLLAAICIISPVAGLRPVRASRWRTSNVPRPLTECGRPASGALSSSRPFRRAGPGLASWIRSELPRPVRRCPSALRPARTSRFSRKSDSQGWMSLHDSLRLLTLGGEHASTLRTSIFTGAAAHLAHSKAAAAISDLRLLQELRAGLRYTGVNPKTYARAVTDASPAMGDACRRRPGNLPPSKCSSSSGLSMNEPFGSIILRTSQDWLRSSHATEIAESRDRAARD